MGNSNDYKFTEKLGTIQLQDFKPRSNKTLNEFIKLNHSKKIFYLQKINEGFLAGKIYSYLLYSPAIEFNLRSPFDLPIGFTYEQGRAEERSEDVLSLALSNNKDNIIFDSAMIQQFHVNVPLIEKSGFSFQVFEHGKLVAHASVVKIPDTIFSNKEIYVILRFIVDESTRKTSIKEFLMKKISEVIPAGQPLYLQVFPENIKALRFFLRRMNVMCVYEKWKCN